MKILLSFIIIVIGTKVAIFTVEQELYWPLIFDWLGVLCVLMAIWRRKKITFNLEPEIGERFMCEDKELKCVKAAGCIWCYFKKNNECVSPSGLKCNHAERKDGFNVKFIVV